MDKNQITGLLLISAMLIGYLYFFSEQPQENQENSSQTEVQVKEDSNPVELKEEVQKKSQISVSDSVSEPDSVQLSQEQSKWQTLYAFTKGNEKIHSLENEFISVAISNFGASINRVALKKHKTYQKDTLVLLDKENHEMSWVLKSKNKDELNLGKLYYEATQFKTDSGQVLKLIAKSNEGLIEHKFLLRNKSYIVDYQINISRLEGLIDRSQNVVFNWNEDLMRYENVLEQSRNHTAVNYYDTKGDFNDVTNDTDPEKVTEKGVNNIRWFSMKQKYFNSGFISKIPMSNGEFSSEFDQADSSVVKRQSAKVEIPIEAFNGDKNFQFYFGPNNFSILKKVAEGYGENIYLGWAIFATVNKYTVVPFFNFLENYISNYGLIILILVLVVKLLLSPLSYKSYVSMAKMKVLKPEIEEIKKKLGDDQQKVQMETMQLYQKFGVNPLSGCIPMVLQIPVLFALFNFFPNSVELRQKSFLWADDLSTYDSIWDLPFNIPFYGDHVSLFTLLMTLSTLAYTYVQNQNNPMQQQGPMKTMQYFFPVMIMFFLNNFSAGLTYYYFLSNIITISQQLLIAKFTDDKEIRSKLESRKQKRSTKKKSGFAARLEEAMKAQQQKQNPKGQKKKKR